MDIEVEWEEEGFNSVQEESKHSFSVVPLDVDLDSTLESVMRLRDKWISRSDEYPFYTLGRCAYLDGKTDAYYNNLERENEMMVREFARLYTNVGEILDSLFDEDVFMTTQLRVPGFHIFPSDKNNLDKAGKWHQDYPHLIMGLDPIDTFAFTLAIQLPKSGGGLDYLDEFHQPQHLAYKEKDLIVHNGDIIHRIAGMKKYVEGEFRITLQGHIVRRDGLLEAFF